MLKIDSLTTLLSFKDLEFFDWEENWDYSRCLGQNRGWFVRWDHYSRKSQRGFQIWRLCRVLWCSREQRGGDHIHKASFHGTLSWFLNDHIRRRPIRGDGELCLGCDGASLQDCHPKRPWNYALSNKSQSVKSRYWKAYRRIRLKRSLQRIWQKQQWISQQNWAGPTS